MKKGIHPTMFDNGISCMTCGTVWPITTTRKNLRVEICANCHPFFTGEQRIVDTAGQVDRFMRRLSVTQNRQADIASKKKKDEPPPKKSLLKELYGDEA